MITNRVVDWRRTIEHWAAQAGAVASGGVLDEPDAHGGSMACVADRPVDSAPCWKQSQRSPVCRSDLPLIRYLVGPEQSEGDPLICMKLLRLPAVLSNCRLDAKLCGTLPRPPYSAVRGAALRLQLETQLRVVPQLDKQAMLEVKYLYPAATSIRRVKVLHVGRWTILSS